MSFETAHPYYVEAVSQAANHNTLSAGLAAIVVPGRYKVQIIAHASTVAAVGAVGQRHELLVYFDDGTGDAVLWKELGTVEQGDVEAGYLTITIDLTVSVSTAAATVGLRIMWIGVAGQGYENNVIMERVG